MELYVSSYCRPTTCRSLQFWSLFSLPFSFSISISIRPNSAKLCTYYPARTSLYMEVAGSDSDGREFKNADEMWREHTGDENKKTQWYRDGVGYWEVRCVGFGGYGHVNNVDVKGSEAFLQTLFSELFVDGGICRHLVALDCGSGIGRVSKNLLYDILMSCVFILGFLVSHFLDAARESLVHQNHMALYTHKATNFFCTPLQDQRGFPEELFAVKMYALTTDMQRKSLRRDPKHWSIDLA